VLSDITIKGGFRQNVKHRIGEFTRRTDCRFCGGVNLTKVLDFGEVPLAGGFLKDSEFSEEKYYPLDLNFCRDCTLLQVSNVVPGDVLFKKYFYFSSAIKTLVDHLEEFAKETNELFIRGRKNPAVFEIGCNDGVMLNALAKLGVRAVGVDPATNVVNSIHSKEITVINNFFSEELANNIRVEHGQFDAITSSYSFAHIDDMVSIIKGVNMLLKDDGVFIFEVYYLGTLINELQYDMIYHEHLSYYSLKALAIFLHGFGMEIFDVKFTPGIRAGAVRFYARKLGKRKELISSKVRDMEQHETEKRYSREGTYLDYVVDDAPAKHGFFTPGTHVAIKPWDFTKQAGAFPEYSLLFAWSFIGEVKKRRADYLARGGKFIVPLPEVSIVTA